MKHLRLVAVLVIALLGMTAFAQELTETFTSSGGLSINVPEGFLVEEVDSTAVGVINDKTQEAFIVVTGVSFSALSLPESVTTAETFMTALAEEAELSEATPVEYALGAGLQVDGDIAGVGAARVIALDADFGLVAIFIAAQSGEVSEEFFALADAMIDTITFDPSLAVAPTEEPAATEEPATTPDGEGTFVCPIPVENLPENTIQSCLGIQFEHPESWGLFEGTASVDNFISFSSSGFGVTAIVTVFEITDFFNPTLYKEQSMPIFAESMGDDDYDPVDSWKVLVEEEGKLIEVYDPRETIEFGGTDAIQVNYIVTLNNHLFVNYTFTYLSDFADKADVEAIEGIVLSTSLTDFYGQTPTTLDPSFAPSETVEFNGETVTVTALECSSATFGFDFTDDGLETYVVRCPACTANDGYVWGTDIYTSDSSVCLAAAHAGTIDLEVGGLLLVTMSEGLDEYVGSEANGITTDDYGTWSASFSTAPFEDAK